MLSRNLYEIEEVCFALLHAIRHKHVEKAVFWANELILSRELTLLNETLIKGWLLFNGYPFINWLDEFVTEKHNILHLVVELCNGPRSRAPMRMFVMAARGIASAYNNDLVEAAINQNDSFSAYWNLGKEYDKKPTAIMSVCRQYVDQPELFDSLFKALKMVKGRLKTLLSVVAVQLLCARSYPEKLIVGSHYIAEFVEGRRFSRIYSIDKTMLPLGYKRVTQEEGLLHNGPDLMKRGCRFWQEIYSSIVDDETFESVHSEYFPDDIPDEWSKASRDVSHPEKSDSYNIYVKPAYRMTLLWFKRPVLRKEWQIESFLDACSAPDQ